MWVNSPWQWQPNCKKVNHQSTNYLTGMIRWELEMIFKMLKTKRWVILFCPMSSTTSVVISNEGLLRNLLLVGDCLQLFLRPFIAWSTLMPPDLFFSCCCWVCLFVGWSEKQMIFFALRSFAPKMIDMNCGRWLFYASQLCMWSLSLSCLSLSLICVSSVLSLEEGMIN